MTSEEYRKRAAECVELANRARASDRPALLQIAKAWVQLADQAIQDDELMRDLRAQKIASERLQRRR